MTPAALTALVALSLTASLPSVPDQVPELLERLVLPVTPSEPVSVDVSYRPAGEPDRLLVGLADGTIDLFYASGSEMIVRVFELGRTEPVDDLRSVRLPGPRPEMAVMALQGSTLSVFEEGTPGVRDELELPPPSGTYRLTRVEGRARDGNAGHDRLLASDDQRVFEVGVGAGANRWGLRVTVLLEDREWLAVRSLSDRAVVVTAGSGVYELTVEDGLRIEGDVQPASSSGGASEASPGGRAVVPVRRIAGTDSMSCRAHGVSGQWRRLIVAVPDSLTIATTIGDSLLLLGGAVSGDTLRDVGWLSLVDADGRVIAATEHGRPPAAATAFDEWIAVQGEGSNLSVYDMSLHPIWDNASQVSPTGVLGLDPDGDGDEDLVVVGIREFAVGRDDAQLIREELNRPRFMENAVRRGNDLVLERPMLTAFRSNAGALRGLIEAETSAASDLARSGDHAEAGRRMMTARAAAAVLGEREQADHLRREAARLLSTPRRERATFLGALVLLLPGMLWSGALFRSRGRMGDGPPIAAAVVLLAAGIAVWVLLGRVLWSFGLPAGGVLLLASVGVVAARRRSDVYAARVPGAAVEELEIGIAEFTHGGHEGSEGRRSITKLALFAQEMLESLDEPDRYETLRSRFAVRYKAFYPAKYDTALELPEHARRAGVAVEPMDSMASAAGRLRRAAETVLADDDAGESERRRALRDIIRGRAELAEAADAAREVVRGNPGCSVRACVTRVMDEKSRLLESHGVDVDLELGVAEHEDAVAIKRSDLYFVIENLVTNAVRAMDRASNRRLRFEGSVSPPFYELRVTDTGAGMSDEETDAAFRVKETDGAAGGFGLPNSREKLRRVGGDIRVDRTGPGRGTRMLVAVPLWRPGRKEGPS